MKKRAQKKKIRGILFDLGGVLLSSDHEFYPHAAKTLGVSEKKLRRVVELELPRLRKGKEDSTTFWHRVCRELSIQMPLERIVKKLWIATYRKNVTLNKPVMRFANRLSKRYPLGIISNTISDHLPHLYAILPRRYFRMILLSPEAGCAKPEKRIFTIASQRMGIPTGQLLFIDDELRWVRSARQAGMPALHYRSVSQLRIALRRYGVVV